jgi:hypothetical protein
MLPRQSHVSRFDPRFDMPTSNFVREDLVHVITILRLVEQKGTAAEVKEAFTALVALREEMSPFFNFPEDETVAKKKQEKRSSASLISHSRPRILRGRTGPEGLQAVPLLCPRQGMNAMDRIVNEMHTKNPWIGMNGESNKGICVKSWISFMDCIELHRLTVFPAEAAEKQHYYMQQTIKKPQRVTVRQFVSRMGVLNDYLAYQPTVFDLLMAVAGTKKMNVSFDEADLAGIVLNLVPSSWVN